MEIVRELEKEFGIVLDITDDVDKKGLPRYMTSGREIFKAQNDDIVFYIVKLPKAVDSRVLSKELMIYEERFNASVAFWFDEITKNNRYAYIKHRIPFIMPSSQVYLPFLGMLFSRRVSGSERRESLPLSPNAQKILFYLLYREKGEYTKRQLADELRMDPVYVTRGTKELISRKYISEMRKGRYTVVERRVEARDLFAKSKMAFSDPVSRVIYVKKTSEVTKLPKASDYALSEISMLNPPRIETYACYKKCELLVAFQQVDEPDWEDPDKICRIELWNYDPLQLVHSNMVDELSLYCSLMNSKDARVQGEIEGMLEEIKWQ